MPTLPFIWKKRVELVSVIFYGGGLLPERVTDHIKSFSEALESKLLEADRIVLR